MLILINNENVFMYLYYLETAVPFEKKQTLKNEYPLFVNVFLNMFDKMAPETVFYGDEYKRLPTLFYYLGGIFWNGGWLGNYIFNDIYIILIKI